MSDAAADLPWLRPSISPAAPCFKSLYKQNSWSPDAYRDEAWKRRKGSHGVRSRRRSKSVTDEDLNELKACIELGFGFDSPEIDHRLSNTLPAYSLYYAVNKQYKDVVCRETSSSGSECESPPCSSMGSPNPHTMFVGPGEKPETVKTRLRQWAQVVACSVRESSH
ncbi:uncharacterized protein LOC124915677 [Impatiens glandulifera]|uniref:uncharacterized protein LOC124915677 n=1 Tax=Impatiens glandulifera TaxID=253017 RepID=UPI001FB1590C|nr:uncharacterized protein LOC124915677 [Impatiens glandulifera]